MSYLVIKSASNATPMSFLLTSTAEKPRLAVGGSYLPLASTGGGATNLKVKVNDVPYRAKSYSTVSSSSSSSTKMTTGYAGTSSKASYYPVTSADKGALSSTTALTRSSTSGYTGYLASSYFISITATTYSNAYTTVLSTGSLAVTSSHVNAYWALGPSSEPTQTTRIGYLASNQTITSISHHYLHYTFNMTSAVIEGNYKLYSFYSSKTGQVYQPGAGVTLYTYYNTEKYLTSSVAPGAMSSTTALTCSSTSGYSGSLSRVSYYYTESTEKGNMSSTTALTSSTSASTSASTTSYV